MKKLGFCLLGLAFTCSAWASVDLSTMLNKVTFTLNADKWVTTQTANVMVSVNAAVNDGGIEKIQEHVLSKLAEISSTANWHIVSYNRQQDKSGLESIQIAAEGRLAQSELNNLRNKAKSLSKPGETYMIENVLFTPSDEEMQQAKTALRAMIYQQAKMEVDTLNKMYPEQKYYIYNIDFNGQPNMPVAMEAMAYRSAGGAVQPMNVGNKLHINAVVVAASAPDGLIKKPTLMNPAS